MKILMNVEILFEINPKEQIKEQIKDKIKL